MKLVPDWKDAWKWHSTKAFAIIAAAPAVWVSLPDDLKSSIPATWLPWIAACVALAGFVGRMKAQ